MVVQPAVSAAPARSAVRLRRAVGLGLALAVLLLVLALSLAVGTRSIPLDHVWDGLWNPNGSEDGTIVHDLRLPRTMLGLLVGAALGAAGALMQALTRNPIPD